MNRMSDPSTFLILTKPDGERYIFVYDVGDTESRSDCLKALGRFASNQDLSFTWYDAAMLSQQVRADAQAYRDEHK
jgi:hypothetical protein